MIGRNTNLLGVRTPSRLELAYLQTATDLTQMIANGHFPFPGQRSDHADSPRVGDGFVRIDASGAVTYASPNALSVYRRLGPADRPDRAQPGRRDPWPGAGQAAVPTRRRSPRCSAAGCPATPRSATTTRC